MKRLVSILLLICLCLSACGNGDVRMDQVRVVVKLIQDIGEVTDRSGGDISKAESFYASLTEEEKAKVWNSGELEQARDDYEAMFVTVALTMDNWQDYFELSEVTGLIASNEGYVLTVCLRAKGPYQKVREEKTDFTATVRIAPTYKHCQRENGTFLFSDIDPENLPELPPETAYTETFSSRMYLHSNQGAYYYHNVVCVTDSDGVSCPDGQKAYPYWELEIVEISGSFSYRKQSL